MPTDDEDRHRHDHAPGERRHRIDPMRQRQLDEDALGGKERGTEQRGNAEEVGVAKGCGGEAVVIKRHDAGGAWSARTESAFLPRLGGGTGGGGGGGRARPVPRVGGHRS